MLATSDGVRIAAAHLINPKAQYTILFSHGNATDLGFMMPWFRRYRDAGSSLFAYDYHGYGGSGGKPTERNTYKDIDAAYAYLTKTLKLPPEQIMAHGQSLGGAPAIDLAARQPLGGLIVESSFVSAFRTVTRYPIIPLDQFKNLQKIGYVRCPVLVIHGAADRIVPLWHGRKLYARANQPKFSWWVRGAGHNDLAATAGSQYWQALRAFAEHCGATN
jgi:fermentation-respiration switch protein FrsA (DUF1100 family)